MLKLLSQSIAKEAKSYDFLNNPLYLFDTIASYREFLLKILEDNVTSLSGEEGEGMFGYSRLQEAEIENGKKIIDAYLSILLQNTLYQSLRQFISVRWNPVTEAHLVNFFDKWKNLMPARLYVHTLMSYIEPKLKMEINKLSARSAIETSLFSWLSPWIELFEQVSTQHELKLYDAFRVTVRLKLIQILKEWHPSNNEMTQEIQRWRKVYDENSWSSLLSQSIVPKLAHGLNKLKVNPQNQQIEPVSWVLKWANQLDTETLASMFAKNLLPSWLQTLNTWLENPDADLTEIMEWYQGWKSLLPAKIIQHEKVQKFFEGALVLIDSKL